MFSSFSKNKLFNISCKVFIFLFCALFFAIFFLMLTHFLNSGINEKSFKAVEAFYHKIIQKPSFLFTSYNFWWNAFIRGWETQKLTWPMFIPWMTPLLLMFYILWSYVRSTYSFGLWYFLNNRFAKLKDVEKMGLTKGNFALLGKLGGKLLKLSRHASILCFGNEGSGKTSCVAIPSIFSSDTCSVIALDNSGLIAKCTSGYRSRLGPVFYFNWDKLDNKEKGEFYARWNPLCRDNIPNDAKKKSLYLQKIVRHLLNNQNARLDNYWASMIANLAYVLLLFYTSKIYQAEANDYFLNEIIEKGRLKLDDKEIIEEYYQCMPPQYSSKALNILQKSVLNPDDYMPIGSWGGIPSEWQGKEANLIMFSDWVKYVFSVDEDSYEDAWKDIIDALKNEAVFFGYSRILIKGLNKIKNLSKQQFHQVFSSLCEILSIFDIPSIREKLCISDFSYSIIKGKNCSTRGNIPVTVYCVSNSKQGKLLSAMLVDLFEDELLKKHEHKTLPVIVVLDDLGKNNKITSLQNLMIKGKNNNISILALGNKLKYIEEVYGKEGLEQIVCNANYKILLADDDKILSQKLENLATYSSKSVQIPAVKTGAFFKIQQGFADSNYYQKIAKNVISKKAIITRGYQLILAEGFYHLPILAQSVIFVRDNIMKKKSSLKPEYFLSDKIRNKRNIQDIEIPYTNTEKNDIESTVANTNKQKQQTEILNNDDWWMNENSFSVDAKDEHVNPFYNKG